MVPDSRKRRKKIMIKSNYIWNREEPTELGAGEQAVTQGLSAGDLLQLEIEQGRTGRRESLVERSWEAGAGPARGSCPTASDGRRRTELADVSTAPQAPSPARVPRYPGRCLQKGCSPVCWHRSTTCPETFPSFTVEFPAASLPAEGNPGTRAAC